MANFAENAKRSAACALFAASLLAGLLAACGRADTNDPQMSAEMTPKITQEESTSNSCTVSPEASQKGILLTEGWLRTAPAGAATSGGYITIENLSTSDDTLVKISTKAAVATELHQSSKQPNGAMVMQALPDGLSIPAGKTVAFAPGGLHLMLIKPTRVLEPCDTIEIIFSFEKAGDIRLTLPAKGIKESVAEDMAH